eukprot:COSAG01_NODE_676_length_14324_cov_17.420105_10_plen_121_part_00
MAPDPPARCARCGLGATAAATATTATTAATATIATTRSPLIMGACVVASRVLWPHSAGWGGARRRRWGRAHAAAACRAWGGAKTAASLLAAISTESYLRGVCSCRAILRLARRPYLWRPS